LSSFICAELLFVIRFFHDDAAAADVGRELAGSTLPLDVPMPCELDELSAVLLAA